MLSVNPLDFLMSDDTVHGVLSQITLLLSELLLTCWVYVA